MTALIVALSLISSVVLGWIVTVVILGFAKLPDRPAKDERILPTLDEPREVLGGGAWIGVLERLAVTGAILAGQPSLIGVVVAIKGLGRWADLQSNPGLTERFIIGTMASYLVAALVGVVGLSCL